MKVLMKIGRVLRRVLAVVLAIIFVLLTVATAIAVPLSNTYESMITMALGQKSFKTDGGNNPQYYTSEYVSEEDLAQASAELCKEIEQEGMVLMTNENNALPLNSGARISLLSQNSVDLVYGGAGAGSVDTSTAANLKTAMESAGLVINPVLWDFYKTGEGSTYRKEVPNLLGMGEFLAHEVPQNVYTEEVMKSLKEYNDAAVIVIGRSGSESVDLPADYLEFTTEEKELIQMATENFETVILLLNVTTAINLSVLNEYDVDACLWIGALGQEGVYAIGEALVGEVNPSGHLVDTWAYDATAAPSYANFGDYTITNSEEYAGTKYMVYAESIYVGYRYYETRYEDVVLGNETSNNFDYANQVQFPFGHGLSYTDFEWSEYQVVENEDAFTVTVTVTNTGDTAGKDTVEIYLQSPYTQYDIEHQVEKSSVELVGFEKTGLLNPGESQTLSILVDKKDLAVYDTNGYQTYILEAGDYYLSAGTDAHDALNNILAAKQWTVSDGMTSDGNATFASLYVNSALDTTTYATSIETGVEITNQLSSSDITTYDKSFVYLSRNDWMGTWPTTYQNGSWEAPQTLIDDLEFKIVEETTTAMPTYDTINDTYGELALVDMIGLDSMDPKWDALLDQLSQDELYHIVSRAGYGTAALESIGLPGVVHKDGPAGISSTLAGGNQSCMAYPPAIVLASTWNKELAKARGEMVGEDSISSEITVWYAPAMNIHRSALSGRNFEYYSEDGFLSGEFGSAETLGYTSKGGVVTIKHFAINDQETNRQGGAMFFNEQSARELYLEAFETPIVEGKANGIMSSMNRIGATWVGADIGLMTNILRNEWGYSGFVITDQTSFVMFSYCDIHSGIAAGNDLWLCTSKNLWEQSEDEMTATFMQGVRTAAQRYLYVIANSNAMNGVDKDTTVSNIMPDWKKFYFVIIPAIILIDILAILVVRKLWGSKYTKEVRRIRKAEKKARKIKEK